MNKKLILIIILVLLLVAGAGFGAVKIAKNNDSVASQDTEQAQESQEEQEAEPYLPPGVIEYNGARYSRNHDIETTLLLGVETGAEAAELGNGKSAGTVFLLITDKANKTTKVLGIDRGTIADVDIYDSNGYEVGREQKKICLQYAYGDSARRSCYLMKKAVSNLLFESRVDNCLAISLDGTTVIADSLGGLNITMPDDYSYLNPAYTKDAVVPMAGAELENFIGFLDQNAGSEEERMQTREWLLFQIFNNLTETGSADTIQHVMDTAGEYIDSDLDDEAISAISETTVDQEIIDLPGAYSQDDPGAFIVDGTALNELVISTFYVPYE